MCAAGGGAEGGLQLGPLFRRIHDEYLQLLTGLPECIEAYEASSASGATLRRFAIVQDSVRARCAREILNDLVDAIIDLVTALGVYSDRMLARHCLPCHCRPPPVCCVGSSRLYGRCGQLDDTVVTNVRVVPHAV